MKIAIPVTVMVLISAGYPAIVKLWSPGHSKTMNPLPWIPSIRSGQLPCSAGRSSGKRLDDQMIREIRSCFVITPRTVLPSTTRTAWFCCRILITVSTSIPGGTVGNPVSIKSRTKKRWVLWRRCCSMALTMTDSDMHPTGTPRSMTGQLGDIVLLKDLHGPADSVLRLDGQDRGMHDLHCRDLPRFGTVQDKDDLVEGADPGIDISRLDPCDHGLADPGAFCQFGLLHAKGFPARSEFLRCWYVHG